MEYGFKKVFFDVVWMGQLSGEIKISSSVYEFGDYKKIISNE